MPLSIKFDGFDDWWDAENERFISVKPQTLELEHTLYAISKWEGKWKKAFYSFDEKTPEETMDYIRCMTLNEVDPIVYSLITPTIAQQIADYISDSMTATTFSQQMQQVSTEKITAEILYYDMVMFNIPFECEHWHINKLIALIRVCAIKNGNGKKMSRADNGVYQRQLNEQRLAAARKAKR